MRQLTRVEFVVVEQGEHPGQAVFVTGDLSIERDRARGSSLLPASAKGEATSNHRAHRLIQIQKYGGVRLRCPREPVRHAN